MRFPEDWPNDCRPSDADEASGDVYRIVRDDPPAATDFATHRETGRLPKAPPCLRCGLSVFRDFRDARHQRNLFPKLGSLIARAALTSDHGLTKLTHGSQPTHTTWWAFEGIHGASLFAVIEEMS
jgi:hypothetical protein